MVEYEATYTCDRCREKRSEKEDRHDSGNYHHFPRPSGWEEANSFEFIGVGPDQKRLYCDKCVEKIRVFILEGISPSIQLSP